MNTVYSYVRTSVLRLTAVLPSLATNAPTLHANVALIRRKCWCGSETSSLTRNGGETLSGECDIECAGTPGETCGGFFRMTVYSIDCHYPDGIPSDSLYSAEGCYVDSRSNRILPDGETQVPMSAAVRGYTVAFGGHAMESRNPFTSMHTV